MIHFFDGFNWPAISTGVLDTNSFSEFWFGGDGVNTPSTPPVAARVLQNVPYL